ncbi:hypothetical protein K5D65_13450 [Pseudomonas cichorii]|nr:hypothetical protein [Pseudomonas cichorii]
MSDRTKPAVFPLGFSAQSTNDVIVVDFVDTPNEVDRNVFFSVALTKDIAAEMATVLKQFVEE